MKEKRNRVVQNACQLLGESGPACGDGDPAAELLAGDGSQRTFYRLRFENGMRVIAIAPSDEARHGMAEALSSWNICNHLHGKGIPVPEYLAFDNGTGLILAEDLGDTRLYEYVAVNHPGAREFLALYSLIIHELVRMQIRGGENFQISWCCQTAFYDRQLMLERESGYFMEALCRSLLGIHDWPPVLHSEFEDIADNAGAAPARFFLHRDFQSRNIMLQEGKVRIIDFQGGRFGPLGYDLASLLIDPYVSIPEALQMKLLAIYLDELHRYIDYDSEQFMREYLYLSLQRNLQILGAFAFLTLRRRKEFFRPFIRPALLSLQSLLAKPLLQKYSSLKQLTELCLEKAIQHDI